ncbi:hypothetical protein B0J11DRAFT_255253 [Dendryphion nanum]|uniref:Uncharacterized protein n=1 Tax=Dendryphion nanum TaxID=256645 RepID=A0A9P9E606_9PLEO|nr:hypothetical protein B0J11DRAFT_255253 [Dendryphion nanum]
MDRRFSATSALSHDARPARTIFAIWPFDTSLCSFQFRFSVGIGTLHTFFLGFRITFWRAQPCGSFQLTTFWFFFGLQKTRKNFGIVVHTDLLTD